MTAYMQRALYAMAHASTCLSVTWVDQAKKVEVKIMQFSLYGSPIPIVFVGCLNPSDGSHPEWGVKQGWSGGNQLFLALCVSMSKTSKFTTNE